MGTMPPPWIELPEGVTENILRRLGAEDVLMSAEKVCTRWRQMCLDPSMWRVVHLENYFFSERKLDLMCRCAVDRSQGQLIDLRIDGFGDDSLLNYVVDRSSRLQRLALAYPRQISAFALIAAIKKLPQLEELHLTVAWLKLGAEDVETIGKSCPLLKSFTLTENGNERIVYGIGLAIAKTMPNLQSLRLDGQVMDNKGLEAILNGCPRLESLNIFHCTGLDLEAGALSERCSKQIKDLTLPKQRHFDLSDVFNTCPIRICAELVDALNSIRQRN